ncbi:MAG: BMC domain-containing protein [Ignavibacteriaceae bacterium]
MLVAIGFLETNSLIGAVEASDVMAKTASIILIGKEVLSNGSITIKIVGEKESVENAISAGREAIRNLERNVSSHIIVDPDEQILSVLPEISVLYYSLNKNSNKRIKKIEEKPKVEAEKIPTVKSEQKIVEPEKSKPQKIKIKKSKNNRPKIEKTDLDKSKIIKTETKIEKIIAPGNKSEEEDILIIRRPEKKLKGKTPKEKTVEEKITEIKERKRTSYRNDTIERLRQEALGLSKSKIQKPVKNEVKKKSKKIISDENNNLNSMNVHQLRKLARDTKNFPIQGREISKAKRDILLDYFNSMK